MCGSQSWKREETRELHDFHFFVGEFVAEIVPALCSLFFKSAPIVEIFVLFVSMFG